MFRGRSEASGYYASPKRDEQERVMQRRSMRFRTRQLSAVDERDLLKLPPVTIGQFGRPDRLPYRGKTSMARSGNHRGTSR
jgi:hypothetical protein